jgi:D-alanyl-D-alanine carboxypeptidase/D-alanyl-D-alanine-endopeptidase (penicillin-binding protein 4)
MGLVAHLRQRADPRGLTFGESLEQWKAVTFRLAATASTIVALLLASAALAGSRSGFQLRLARALRVPHVSPGQTGAIAIDLRTGRTLFAQNAHLPLRPASNEKLATTYAALTGLGPSFRIETDVLGDGTQSGTVWHGDLVLKGYGDPSLNGAELVLLAHQVAAAGIRRVSGRVVGDESWFDPRRAGVGWKADFYLHQSPALSALIVNRGWTGRYETSRPALYAAQLFRRDLQRTGVTVGGAAAVGVAPAGAMPLADVESPPVSALVRHMDVYSDNFYAEMLLKEIGAVQGRAGSAAAGVAVTRRLLAAAGVPLAGVRMVDGSGLSLVDRWTPAGLATLLRAMWLNPDVQPYVMPALPIAGETGTLEHRMRTGPARGHVRAKTGTTNNSSALSGFVGDHYVFSIVENGRPVKTFYAEQSQNHFAQVLARAGS